MSENAPAVRSPVAWTGTLAAPMPILGKLGDWFPCWNRSSALRVTSDGCLDELVEESSAPETLLGKPPRGRCQVLIAEASDPAVVSLGERGHPSLAQSDYDGDRGTVQASPLQLRRLGVREDAEQPELLATGP
jgi:hypothetical protein